MTYFDGYDPEVRVIAALVLVSIFLLFALGVVLYDNWKKRKEIEELKSQQRITWHYKKWSSTVKDRRQYRKI